MAVACMGFSLLGHVDRGGVVSWAQRVRLGPQAAGEVERRVVVSVGRRSGRVRLLAVIRESECAGEAKGRRARRLLGTHQGHACAAVRIDLLDEALKWAVADVGSGPLGLLLLLQVARKLHGGPGTLASWPSAKNGEGGGGGTEERLQDGAKHRIYTRRARGLRVGWLHGCHITGLSPRDGRGSPIRHLGPATTWKRAS